MSGICGIIHLDGAPVDPESIGKMVAAIQYRGPDGVHTWQEGEAALGFLRLHTTPESHSETQPMVHWSGRHILVADARIDNRPELIPYLRTRGFIHRKHYGDVVTDAEIILGAYDCWGSEAPFHLVGDFAFAIYEPAERKLFLARDAIGIRQLVYYQDKDQFLFATSLAAITALLPPQPLNRDLMQDWIAGVFDRYVYQTPYTTILRLPPSYTLTVTPEKSELKRYFVLGEGPKIRYKKDEEYFEHFRELFAEVVRAQLRCDRPAAIMSGGGLDSSAITCMAQREIAAGRVKTPVGVYGMMFTDAPEADESEYFDALRKNCAYIDFLEVNCDNEWVLKEAFRNPHFPLDDFDLISTHWHGEPHMMRTICAEGRRVSLAGIFGDQILGQWIYQQPVCLRDLPLSAWRTELPSFRVRTRCSTWQIIGYAGLRPLLSLKTRKYLWGIVGHFIKRFGSIEPLSKPSKDITHRYLPPPPLTFVSQLRYQMLYENPIVALFVGFDKWTAYHGTELRLPYLDRRFVDIMIRFPTVILARKGVTRYILRESLFSILPERIRNRTSKSPFDHLRQRGFSEEGERIRSILVNSNLTRHKLIGFSSLMPGWEKAISTPDYSSKPLQRIISLECWLSQNRTHYLGV